MARFNFNSELIDKLKSSRVRPDDALCYLLCLYYNLEPVFIPDSVKITVNSLKIVLPDTNSNTLDWAIPLFEGSDEDNFSWVKTEYMPMFSFLPRDRKATLVSVVPRMKKLFKEHQHVTKNKVLQATELYIKSTDPMYVRRADYFIEKDVGSAKTQDILIWIEKLDELSEFENNRKSLNNLMQ